MRGAGAQVPGMVAGKRQCHYDRPSSPRCTILFGRRRLEVTHRIPRILRLLRQGCVTIGSIKNEDPMTGGVTQFWAGNSRRRQVWVCWQRTMSNCASACMQNNSHTLPLLGESCATLVRSGDSSAASFVSPTFWCRMSCRPSDTAHLRSRCRPARLLV